MKYLIGISEVEVEIDELEMEFTLDTANIDEIINEIVARTGLDKVVVEKIIEIEIDEETIEKVRELAYELEETLIELGKVYLEIFDELNETTIVAENRLHDITHLISEVEELDIDPYLEDALITKLNDALNKTEQSTVFIQDGRVMQAWDLVNETDDILNLFIIEVVAKSDRIGEDAAESLVERVEEIVEDADGEFEELFKELEEILVEFDLMIQEVHSIVAEIEALGGDIEVSVKGNPEPTVAIFVAGTVVLVITIAAATLFGMLADAIYRHFLRDKYDIKLKFEQKVVIFVATPELTLHMGYKDPETLGDIIGEGMTGDVTFGVIAKFIASAGIRLGEILGQIGLELVFVRIYQVITTAPGMGEFRWFDGDFGWTHVIPAALVIESARIAIIAFDVDWGAEPHWEHNRIYADGRYISTLTGTPPRRWNNVWSITTMDINPILLEDQKLNVFVDIDANHNFRRWVTNIGGSVLEVA